MLCILDRQNIADGECIVDCGMTHTILQFVKANIFYILINEKGIYSHNSWVVRPD